MDPLASVKEFRQQGTGPGRTLKVAPPPPMPAAPAPADPAVDLEGFDPTGEVDLTDHPTGPAAEATRAVTPSPDRVDPVADAESAEGDDTIGMARGRKRLIHVYLPGETRQRLEAGRQQHGTLGAAVMAALRGSYQWVVEHHTPEPVEPVGPFPAPRPPRRRLAVPDARLKPFYVNPDEAKAIDELADQLELSVSELVTIAIDRHYGDTTPSKAGRSAPAPTRSGS